MTGEGKSETGFGEHSVLVLVENLSVPFDRRVWQECKSLRRAGFDVTVVSPRGQDLDAQSFEERDGIKINRFPLRPANGGALSYVGEYASALRQIRRLVRKLSQSRHFDVVHACNPPDLLLLTALRLKRRHGARLIFDHHDLAPEVYLSRFARNKDVVYRLLCALERLSFRLADVVIATNESYRDVALTRGRKQSEDVFVVRNGPDLEEFAATDPDETLKQGKSYLIAYVGVMGPQDGIDYALRALAALADRRTDWHAVFVGDGDVVPSMRELAERLGISDSVEFTGLVEKVDVLRVLSTADVCLAPEPMNPLNDVSTMIKVAEYMALGCPIVSFDLRETRATARDAALYAPPNDAQSFGQQIDDLLNDDELRRELGERGRNRVQRELSWAQSEQQLLAAYARALDGTVRRTEPALPRSGEAAAA
jgi:glycosyltransferase involved in cell wall biosynthesis